ncbi:zinc-dependent metalloproteinase lipoprotein [Porphyromonadaceae bacterium W3.11]|nr:zinc-dependent metalloproteinase lipoprotein [Porphyromonadaceae bacterium W3.11]
MNFNKITMKNISWILFLLILITSCNKGINLPDLEASQDEVVVDHQGYDKNDKAPVVLLTANAKWEVTSSADWLSTNTSKGGTRTLVTIKVSPNFTDKERQGLLTFKNENAEIAIKVIQGTGEVDIEQITYEVPVIFHVIYNEDDINNPDEKKRRHALNSQDLQTILYTVNRFYGAPPTNKQEEEEDEKNLRERNGVPKIETRIRFVLAKEDPSGKKLPNMGVTRTVMPEKFIDPYSVLNSKEGESYHDMAWPLDKYINVFVFPFKAADQDINQGMVLGVASMPRVPESKPIDGLATLNERVTQFSNYTHCIVLNAEAFEERVYGDNKTFLGERLGLTTLAHELGHYLGLSHTFTEIKQKDGGVLMDACEDTDYCKDTPTYNRVSYIRTAREILSAGGNYYTQVEGLLRRTDCSNAKFISTNIMDYEWSHSDRFTHDQVERMRHVLYYSPIVPGQKLIDFSSTRAMDDSIEVEPHFSVCTSLCHHHH